MAGGLKEDNKTQRPTSSSKAAEADEVMGALLSYDLVEKAFGVSAKEREAKDKAKEKKTFFKQSAIVKQLVQNSKNVFLA